MPNWFKIKVAMMPELVALAKASLPEGTVSQAFLDKETTEAMVGASNALPLLIELIMGSFRPKLFSERK